MLEIKLGCYNGTWCKTRFISEKLTVKTWDNGRQHPPKLKLLLVLEQSIILRLGGSRVASMFALYRYPVHNILLYPYVLRVSWLIPICSEWWGLFHILSLALSGWRTEQPSPEYFPAFAVQVHSRNISQVCIWLIFPEGTLNRSRCMILTKVETWPTSSYSKADIWSFG